MHNLVLSTHCRTCACMQNTWVKSHQGVAARVDGDKAAFYVEGAIDFILSNGKAFFEVYTDFN